MTLLVFAENMKESMIVFCEDSDTKPAQATAQQQAQASVIAIVGNGGMSVGRGVPDTKDMEGKGRSRWESIDGGGTDSSVETGQGKGRVAVSCLISSVHHRHVCVWVYCHR